MKCGHQEPSSELNANTAKSPYTFEDIYSIELTPKYSKLVFNNRTEVNYIINLDW